MARIFQWWESRAEFWWCGAHLQTMAEEVTATLRAVRDKLLTEPVSPRVEEPRDINLHYCRYVAETVAEQVSPEPEVEILEDGGRGFVHTWVRSDGRHFDAECIEGVTDYRALPFFQRHPEAVVHPEPGQVDAAAIRTRGIEPLYPPRLRPDDSGRGFTVPSSSSRKFALLGVLVGLLLLSVGIVGEWAIHGHILHPATWLTALFRDFQLAGELIVLVAPLIFLLFYPAHHEDATRYRAP